MASEERSAWAMVIVTIVAYSTYLSLILGGGASLPLAPADYGWTLLWTILGAMVVAVATEVAFAMVDGLRGEKRSSRRDERDRRIQQLGEYTGQAFVVMGGVGTLILAVLEVDQFWIANLVYLTFALSALLGSITKISLHRGVLLTW